MKDNVDLTINRKFSRNRNSSSSDLRSTIFKLTSNVTYPWVMNISRITSTLDRSNAIIFTGNKKEREFKKNEFNYMNASNCECCGANLNKKPWTRSPYLLCSKCDYSLKESVKTSYWLESRHKFVKRRSTPVDNTSTEEISVAELLFNIES